MGTMDGKQRWLSLVLLMALNTCVAILAACASTSVPAGPPEADRAAQAVVTAWLAALSAGDGDAACPLMTEAARAQLTTNQHAPDCAAAVRSMSAALGPAGRDQLRKASVGPVTLRGQQASAAVASGTVALRQQDGRWLIDDLATALRAGSGGAYPPPTGFVPSPPATTR
jgi:hypothetical protein